VNDQVHEGAVTAGSKLWQSNSLPAPTLPSATEDEMKHAVEVEAQRNSSNLQSVYFFVFLVINKKYVLWNAGICPIASKVGHMTLATPPLGSFIVLYVVLAMAYPTKKKRRV